MKSMTGYGRGEYIADGRRFSVEIKAVNHRYNDLTLKMPRFLNPLDDEIRKLLSKEISRGKVDVGIHFETQSTDDVRVAYNKALLELYLAQLDEIAQASDRIRNDLSLSMVTRLPDLFIVEKNSEIKPEVKEGLFTAINKALSAFLQMKETEGNTLLNDLLEKITNITDLIKKIEAKSPETVNQHEEKLRERISEMLQSTGYTTDEGRLLTEIAIFADKSTIDEELQRLISHIDQFVTTIKEDGSIGRKLDFIVQEMNRETNTIGSKSSNIEISKMVVELKTEIEKIREQVQNIE
jgi:uncharacterized protein (TIGR00255 family)